LTIFPGAKSSGRNQGGKIDVIGGNEGSEGKRKVIGGRRRE